MEALTLFDPASLAIGPTLFWQQADTKQTVLEFFAARIRNSNTRAAYLEALKQFAEWAAVLGKEITDLNAVDVACYVENHAGSLPTVKQHLSAVKRFLDFLTTRGHLPFNPALSVKAPRFADTQGKTAFLADEEPQQLLTAIDISTLAGLRDRALIAAMLYTFARVSAVTNMRVEDYAPRGKRWWFTLHEKGGKRHRVPANHKLEEAMDAYLAKADISSQGNSPLFRGIHGPSDTLLPQGITRQAAFMMVRRRSAAAGLPAVFGCHSFRATGITAFRKNGGSLEKAQQIAAHASSSTTKLYDRSLEEVTMEEVERIRI